MIYKQAKAMNGAPETEIKAYLRGEIFDLSLAKDNVGIRGRRLEDIRLRNHEQDVLALLDRDANDPSDWLHSQLLHRLPVPANFVTIMCSDLFRI